MVHCSQEEGEISNDGPRESDTRDALSVIVEVDIVHANDSTVDDVVEEKR